MLSDKGVFGNEGSARPRRDPETYQEGPLKLEERKRGPHVWVAAGGPISLGTLWKGGIER